MIYQSPTLSLVDKTLYDAWNGKNQSLENFVVLDCNSYHMHVLNEKISKLDNKVEKYTLRWGDRGLGAFPNVINTWPLWTKHKGKWHPYAKHHIHKDRGRNYVNDEKLQPRTRKRLCSGMTLGLRIKADECITHTLYGTPL